MVKPIILTGRNFILTGSGFNNTFRYTFPNSITIEDGDQIALSGAQLWYNWNNISRKYNNTKLTYYWFDNNHPYGTFDSTNTFNVEFPNGFYSTDYQNTYNEFLQKVQIDNKTYLINQFGQNVFFIEFQYNNVYGKVQLICYPIPSTLPTGWSYPAGASWTLPSVLTCPVVEFKTNSKMNIMVGFDIGQYPPSYEAVTYSVLAPTVSAFYQSSSINVSCSILRNIYSRPATTLFNIPIGNSQPGDAIVVNPGNYAFCDIQAGVYSEFLIQLFDQDYDPIDLKDTDALFYLLIQRKKDVQQLLR